MGAWAVACALVMAPAVPAGAGDVRESRSYPRCDGPVSGCVDEAERVLVRLRDELGCDHRAPFATVYVSVQQALAAAVRRPGAFEEPSWLAGDLNTGFVGLYLAAHRADRAGSPVPRAWRIAFDTARSGDANAGQDVLLGANAHIQRDMPYVLARLGTTRPDGTSRKPDYDRFQSVLERAYGPGVRQVARRYDPVAGLADDRWNPVAGLTVTQLLRVWREQAWVHARRLTDARDDAARRRVARDIEHDAARWAALLAVAQVPGYRRLRDAHCADGPAGPRSPQPVEPVKSVRIAAMSN
ncbi:hypothetical protein GCM10010365_16900 [Streptomyces poonensis]|uniref:Secreted protein n=1 Tax=Streptomyces poonensis TaxID=68255 RepID=A0A918PCI6_9ACTN|nr:hypothetical protein GCM10010365_16900 [Streptomyces poonensis]